jgi:hypothetical protein
MQITNKYTIVICLVVPVTSTLALYMKQHNRRLENKWQS